MKRLVFFEVRRRGGIWRFGKGRISGCLKLRGCEGRSNEVVSGGRRVVFFAMYSDLRGGYFRFGCREFLVGFFSSDDLSFLFVKWEGWFLLFFYLFRSF